jgi:hypothetical protein
LIYNSKNIQFIHKKLVRVGDIHILGYGGGGFSTEDKEFESFIKKHHDTLKNNKSIIVTHAPPYGTIIDQVFNDHCGNKSITSAIKKVEPLLAISGHLHETMGKQQKLGKTTVINPGPQGKVFSL